MAEVSFRLDVDGGGEGEEIAARRAADDLISLGMVIDASEMTVDIEALVRTLACAAGRLDIRTW